MSNLKKFTQKEAEEFFNKNISGSEYEYKVFYDEGLVLNEKETKLKIVVKLHKNKKTYSHKEKDGYIQNEYETIIDVNGIKVKSGYSESGYGDNLSAHDFFLV